MPSEAIEETKLDRQLAATIRQLINEELDRREPKVSALGDYDDPACSALAGELGVNSLNRANDFFAKLAADGAVDSVAMATHMSLGTPRNISSALTTPIKRIAKRLGLALPWRESETANGRTLWCDRDGIAQRMHEAVASEQSRRAGISA